MNDKYIHKELEKIIASDFTRATPTGRVEREGLR